MPNSIWVAFAPQRYERVVFINEERPAHLVAGAKATQMLFGVGAHAAELHHREVAAVEPHSPLPEEDRTW